MPDTPDLGTVPAAELIDLFREEFKRGWASHPPDHILDVVGRALEERFREDDTIDPTVGFVITSKPGDKVLEGEPIASVFAKDADGIQTGFEALGQAIVIGDKLAQKPLKLVSHRVTRAGVEILGTGG